MVFITDRRNVTPAAVNTSPGRACSAAASSSTPRVHSAATQDISAGSTGSRSRVRASMRDLRWGRSFVCEASLALTGQRTAHGPHRAGSSSAHSAMSR
ncbi:hypothetical protein MSM1_03435 [Mycobacterium sp. SM1]|uniref:hypothetical protein n=1 Tax=Mycobacterium sp. SM1 TaxID=2816243 RepID=UPI001BCCCA87|nr:hypothetical protein [Mycobacterium sp. SM1]MBS4727448.1 hypothetical protein [Mycobacterium sp. SM1]